jgi:hypothetical protein
VPPARCNRLCMRITHVARPYDKHCFIAAEGSPARPPPAT